MADRQCAWCGRLKRENGTPYGPRLELQAGRSHGICVECLAVEKAKLETYYSQAEPRLPGRRVLGLVSRDGVMTEWVVERAGRPSKRRAARRRLRKRCRSAR